MALLRIFRNRTSSEQSPKDYASRYGTEASLLRGRILEDLVYAELPVALVWLILGLFAGLVYALEMVGLDGSMTLLSLSVHDHSIFHRCCTDFSR